MAGCYGNDSFDKYWESQLDNYLEDYDNDEEDQDQDQDQDEDEDEDYEQLKNEIRWKLKQNT